MTDAAAPAALEVAGLSHAFGKRAALDGVGLAIAPGDFCVLLGLNGAGKTTLFALVTRLYHASSGRIAVFGHDTRREPLAALARMGVVFQQPTLDLDLTVAQNLQYHAALHGMASAAAAPRIETELERVGLAARRGDRVRHLSGGQRRRVEVARRWSTRRRCCCSTSRPSGSTSRAAPSCSRMCGCCAASRASACCGRPT